MPVCSKYYNWAWGLCVGVWNWLRWLLFFFLFSMILNIVLSNEILIIMFSYNIWNHWCSVHSFVYSFNKYLLSIYRVPDVARIGRYRSEKGLPSVAHTRARQNRWFQLSVLSAIMSAEEAVGREMLLWAGGSRIEYLRLNLSR